MAKVIQWRRVLSFKLTDTMYQALEAAARAESRPISFIVRRALDSELDRLHGPSALERSSKAA